MMRERTERDLEADAANPLIRNLRKVDGEFITPAILRERAKDDVEYYQLMTRYGFLKPQPFQPPDSQPK
jgi:hypothetical protein